MAMITHMAFYAGWRAAICAVAVAREVFAARVWILSLALLASGGCATVPPPTGRPQTYAVTPDATTPLSRVVTASLPDAASDLSGVRLLPGGGFRRFFVHRAVQSIDAQYYDFADDAVGRSLLAALRNAADRGVRVRLLVDDLSAGDGEELFLTFAAHPHVEVRLFNPLPFRTSSPAWRVFFSLHEFPRINRRMHNKLFIADSAVALLGGRNLGTQYFLLDDYANYIDLDVLVSGPVVRELAAGFDRYWNSPYAYAIETLAGRSLPPEAAGAAFDALAGPDQQLNDHGGLDALGQPSIVVELESGRLNLTGAHARAMVDDPAKVERRDFDQPSEVAREALNAIATAKREVLIVSPYFVPGNAGMQALRQARHAGVAITVVTNSLLGTDQPWVHGKYAERRRELLELGVRLFELSTTTWTNRDSFGNFRNSIARLHAKTMVVDQRHVFLGSMNMDGRSMFLNTEVAVYVDSEPLAIQTAALIALMTRHRSYEVRLGPEGNLQWAWVDQEGVRQVTDNEPGTAWWQRFASRFLASFLREEMF